MMNIKIPGEVVEAAARDLSVQRRGVDCWSEMDEDMRRFYRREALAALAAGLAAWPNAWTSQSVGNGSLILPLPQEKPND